MVVRRDRPDGSGGGRGAKLVQAFLARTLGLESMQYIIRLFNFILSLVLLTETFELPGVVPYPEEGRLATDHLLPSAFLMLANANWLGETLGESSGETTLLAAAAIADGE